MTRLRLLAVALPLALAACGGSLFQSKVKPPTIYMLTAGAAVPGVEIPVDLAMLKPRVRAGLDTDRIAALYPDRRLDYFADARWSAPLDEILQDFAMLTFHSRANLRDISGDSSVFFSAYWLEMLVVDFQAEYSSPSAAPTVHVHLLGRLGTSGERHILGRFEADVRQPATENRMGAIVDAYAHAADQAFAEIAADAADTLRKNAGNADPQKADRPVASSSR